MSYAGNTILFHVMFDGRKNEHFLEKNVFFLHETLFVVAKRKTAWLSERFRIHCNNPGVSSSFCMSTQLSRNNKHFVVESPMCHYFTHLHKAGKLYQ